MKITFACAECGKLHTKQENKKLPAKFCSIACKSAFQRRARPVTKDWLYDCYVTKKLDCTQISKLVGRDSKSVWNWLKDFGIETRKRGYSSTKKFQKGTKTMLGKKHSEETKRRLREIAISKKRVPYKPEIGSYMKGRRGALHPNWKGGVTAERQSFYSTPEWALAVKSVWKRDRAQCQKCGKEKSKHRDVHFDIHHIVSFKHKSLRHVVSNLVLLCEPCHYWVHSRKNTGKEFLASCIEKEAGAPALTEQLTPCAPS